MLSAAPILASAVEPLTLLVAGLIVLVVVVVVGEVVGSLLRARARKKGRAGVALVVREDRSGVVPDDLETKDMDGGSGLRASETALDLAAQPQQELQPQQDSAKPAEAGNIFDEDEDAAAAIDELNRALEDAQRDEEGPEDDEIEFDSENLAALQTELDAEEQERENDPGGAAQTSAATSPARQTEFAPRDETRPFPPSGVPQVEVESPSPPPSSSSPSQAAEVIDATGARCDVVLAAAPADEAARLEAIRVVRQFAPQQSLFAIMQAIDAPPPSRVVRNVSRAEAQTAREALHKHGVTADVAPHEPEPEPALAPSGEVSAEGALEVSDEDLEAMADRARKKKQQQQQGKKKKKKTFAEYEEDRRRLLAKREAEKAERQARWRERLKQEVLFVGRGVSAGLIKSEVDREKLARFGLAELGSAEQVCEAMGITPTEMRWLCFHREDAESEHYSRFTIPKRSGGDREISSPKPKLRKAQSWILENVLAKVPVSDASHGFVEGRGTRTNAEPHLRAACVIKLDVRDFFPSITYPRVKGLLQRSLGFGEAAATVMALLVTEPPRVTADLNGKQYRVAVGKRQLPQGACTSPAITNILCRRLDARLRGLTKKFGFTYTRYADDITISGPTGERKVVGQLIGGARRILKEEGFEAHEDKISVHRRGRQQRVTGIVVNEKLSLDRRHVRHLRAILHDTLQNGPEKANRNQHPNFLGWLQGHIAYLHMIDPTRAKPMKEKIQAIREKWGRE